MARSPSPKPEKAITLDLKPLKLATGVVPIKYREGSSLLTNKVAAEVKEKIADGDGKGAKTRDADDEFQSSLYVIDKENKIYGFPAAGIMKCLVHAGGRMAGETMTHLRAALVVEPDHDGLVKIYGPPPSLRTDLIRTDGGKLQVANRAEFKEWRMKVRVQYNYGLFGESKGFNKVINLFQQGGFGIGIGCWRPEKNGTFGRFEVDVEALVGMGIDPADVLDEKREE